MTSVNRKSASNMERDSNNMPSNYQDKTYTVEEYFPALEKWLHEAYMWQSFVASFPYLFMYNHCANQTSHNLTQVPNSADFLNFQQVNRNAQNNTTQQTPQAEGLECRIPPMWKRLVAEFLDFSILFIVKLAVTFIAIDFFEIIDLEKFDFGILQKDLKLDYKLAMQMTHDIMILEIIHRVLVCIFETMWLAKGLGGRIGGATPGKTMLGLCVVRCESISPLRADEEVVLVKPGTDLGVRHSFLRAFIKNLVLAFFIPASFAFLYFRHNRAGYDMLCNTIVIEEPTRQRRPHQQ